MASSMGTPRQRLVVRRTAESDMFEAVLAGDLFFLQYTLKNVTSITVMDKQGYTVLHLAALQASLDCMKLLVEQQHMDVNILGAAGRRPIHLVISKKNGVRALHCLKYLIQHGAWVNVENQERETPLHKAACEGMLDCVTLLVDSGADPRAQDCRGNTPLSNTKLWGHQDCGRYLKDVMWKKDKAEQAQELINLKHLKCKILKCEIDKTEEFTKKKEQVNQLKFESWIDQKGFSDKLKTVKVPGTRTPHSPHSLAKGLKGTIPAGELPGSAAGKGSWKKTTSMKKPEADKKAKQMGHPAEKVQQVEPEATAGNVPSMAPKEPWNLSTNPASPLVTEISRPPGVRLGTHPEESPGQHDFREFLCLSQGSDGHVQIHTFRGDNVLPAPRLPLEVLKKSLFPGDHLGRIQVPQDFHSRYILDLQRRRPPSQEQVWSEMAMHLSETLEPRRY
ncbi:ankyrin repeat domain-containing protein 53 isoform X1 [Acipenser ruthenus]|uniref:ankyrin repeat domain-containing protein 53 isoform X1 n=1 Tax=Acipenser ruthenus TaxID=7906 RepID=UPI00274125A8|nr:ankyrin repeat domain-containing protein 53 isoform X1 [Acipenser ruthenus]